jgi:outer membrane lipoprotein carrier protein
MHTYQAQFKQITLDAKGHLMQQGSGSIALSRPGYLRWETFKPTHQILWVNKNTVWIYDVDLEQVSKNQIQTNSKNPSVLLSSSVSQMKQQFSIKKVSTQDHLLCFTLYAKNVKSDADISIPNATLCFQNGILKTMSLKQDFGGSTQFSFSNIKTNQSISTSVFRFSAPKGTQVLTN